MSDIARQGDLEVKIVDPTGQYGAKVDSFGSMQNRLFDVAGNLLIGQKAMVDSIPVTIASNQTVVPLGGDVAHDGVDSGNPVKIGLKAISHGTNPTAVSANDRTNCYANRHGVPFIIGGHPNIVTLRANYTTAQTDTALVTIASGLKIIVTRCSVAISNACTVNVPVRIGFGTANTPTTTGVVLSHPGIAPGSGMIEGNGGGILGIGADDEDLRITSSAPTTGSMDVVISYYTIES